MLKMNKSKINLILVLALLIFLFAISTGTCAPKHVFNLGDASQLYGDACVMVHSFIASVEYLSGGDIEINYYPRGEWGGSEEEYLEQIQLGTLDIAMVAASGPVGQYTDALFFLSTPFLFQDVIQMMTFMIDTQTTYSQVLEEKIEQASKEAKFQVLSLAPSGGRGICTAEPLESLKDIKGKKIRVMNNPVQVDSYNFLGAIATPLPYSEVFTALQLNTIDGAEFDAVTYLTMRFVEPAPYYKMAGFNHCINSLVMSKKAWDSLPPSYQTIIKESAVGGGNLSIAQNIGTVQYLLNSELKELAKGISTIKPEDLKEARKEVLPKLLDKYHEEIGMDVIEALAEGDEVISNWLKNK